MVSLQDLCSERMIERMGRGLLERAERGLAAIAPQSPFYRLSAHERFVLGALHQARWSYARVARVLELEENQVAELAWGARLQLATAPGTSLRVPFPSAAAPGMECPEYHPGRPWTQRFLDEELSPRERAFLQGHAEGCMGCRKTLERAREFYHGVGKWVPRLTDEERVYWERELSRVQDRSVRFRDQEPSFAESLLPFFRRWDIRLLFAVALAALVRASLI